jgi:hypothetical protein
MGRPSLAGLSPILACPLRPAHDLGVRPELPTGPVTFLFTEVEGSTGLLQELGAERYPDALAPGNPHAWGSQNVNARSIATAAEPAQTPR